MALEKQIVSWPLTGGLQTKKGPLGLQPGSFLQLDNVRQEREAEWRNRQGIVGVAADTALAGNPPLRLVELPGGGAWGLIRQVTNGFGAVQYAPSVAATAARWTRPPTSQLGPGVWSRRPVSNEDTQVTLSSIAVGNGFRLVAWNFAGGIKAVLLTDSEGAATGSGVVQFGGATAIHPKCAYESTTNRFLLFWGEGANLNVAQWNGATGALINGGTTLKNNVAGGQAGRIDALVYSNQHVTVVYGQAGGNAHQLEVNPSTLALDTDVDLGVNCANALALLPDPDGSGVRFVAVGTATPDVRVLRTTTAAAITTNTQAAVGAFPDQIIGCAYQAGAGWMIVYHELTTGSLMAVKFRSAVVSAAQTLTPPVGTLVYVDSNAWREPGTDAMRYMAGIHLGGVGTGATGDTQHNYYEMALEFENGSATIGNQYTEPQARLLPLNAGLPAGAVGAVVQVIRVAANHFAVSLLRLSQYTLTSGVQTNRYAIDQWDVIYPTGSIAGLNLGPGAKGTQASYIPAGMLLQSVNGESVVGHGAGALPFAPGCAPAAGAGLSSAQAYRYVTTLEYVDENGNTWRSAQSVPSQPITPTGGNLRVTVTSVFSTFENAFRYRTLKLWRTLGNGSVYQLVAQTTRLSDYTNAVWTYLDSTTDALLAQSNFLPVGLPASITPAFNHVAFFDGRMWGAERDFPTKLRWTKLIQAGVSPEFPAEFVVDLADELGPITGIQPLDDKLIVFKDSAIYFVPMGGPNDDGSGSFYSTPTRIDASQGSKLGTPAVSTGESVWFYAREGVYKIDRSLQVAFVGEPIDKWFNQELETTPETPISFTHNKVNNEIRLLTTNYRFVYDMIHGVWIRDTGGPAGALSTIHLAAGDLFIRPNGEVWIDYDVTSAANANDNSGVFIGTIRSAWVRSQVEGWGRLYRYRSVYVKTGAAVVAFPIMLVYFDNNDALVETSSKAGGVNPAFQRLEMRLRRQKCSAFSLAVQLPSGDMSWRFDLWTVLVGIKQGMQKLGTAERVDSA